MCRCRESQVNQMYNFKYVVLIPIPIYEPNVLMSSMILHKKLIDKECDKLNYVV